MQNVAYQLPSWDELKKRKPISMSKATGAGFTKGLRLSQVFGLVRDLNVRLWS